MTLACPTCGGRMPGHRRVCRPCDDGLDRDLVSVPGLAADLDLALSRQTRLGRHSGGAARPADSGLSWDERARQAEQHLRAILVGWVRLLNDSVNHDYAGPACPTYPHRSCRYLRLGRLPADTLPAIAAWLTRHRQALLAHPAAEAIEEIRQAVRQSRRAIDLPPEYWFAGPCNTPAEDGDALCQADLYAQHGAHQIRCRSCGAAHDLAYRLAWVMWRAEDHLGTATEIARALSSFGEHVTAAAVRGYAHRDRLLQRGVNRAGHPFYRLGDVIALLPPREQPTGDPA